jgi:AraC-like DNA-binding protein
MNYIIAIGIFQTLLGLVPISKRVRNSADSLLLALIICIGLHLAIKFVIFNFIGNDHIRMQFNTFIQFCYSPLLYLYTARIKNHSVSVYTKLLLFIPFILAMFGYFIVAAITLYAPEKGYDVLTWYNIIAFLGIIIINIVYAALSLKMSSGIFEDNRNEIILIKAVAYLFIAAYSTCIVFYVLELTRIYSNLYYVNYVRAVMYLILLVVIIVIQRYRFFLSSPVSYTDYTKQIDHTAFLKQFDKKDIDTSDNEVLLDKEEYVPKKFILSHEVQESILIRLKEYMITSKGFTDETLNLDKLAANTNINKYHISETLNNFAHTNFYKFVNNYRIEYAKERIHYFKEREIEINILSLAYDIGFNSKSSFNRYFKEFTGLTPSEYIKKRSNLIIF